MYIRRKVFSRIETEGEVKLFSLKEKWQKNRAEKKAKKAAKKELNDSLREYDVNRNDKDYINSYNESTDKQKDKMRKLHSSNKNERDEQIQKNKKGLMVGFGATGAINGAIIGSIAGNKGAAIGAGVGAGLGAVGVHAISKHEKRVSERAEKYKGGHSDKMLERARDSFDVADKKMSADKFAKKWNKYDKDHK